MTNIKVVVHVIRVTMMVRLLLVSASKVTDLTLQFKTFQSAVMLKLIHLNYRNAVRYHFTRFVNLYVLYELASKIYSAVLKICVVGYVCISRI